MMVTLLTFSKMWRVGCSGGLNSPITEKASGLWTEPVSFYLGEKQSNMLIQQLR